MTNQLEMVNGSLQSMSDADQAAYDARQVAWPAIKMAQEEQVTLPDSSAQIATLTAALIARGTIKANDLPATTLTAINNKLKAIGATKIT